MLNVKERPVLEGVQLEGVTRLSDRTIRDLIDLPVIRPIDPAAVARAIHQIDSTYEKAGYYLARVRAESTVVSEGTVGLTFIVEEGRRLALSGLRVIGNEHIPAEEIAGAMRTKPEGFWFFRSGEISDDEYAADLSERIPALYARRGFIDFQISTLCRRDNTLVFLLEFPPFCIVLAFAQVLCVQRIFKGSHHTRTPGNYDDIIQRFPQQHHCLIHLSSTVYQSVLSQEGFLHRCQSDQRADRLVIGTVGT
jgi:hypothetical protein